MARKHNFYAGPAILPLEVMQKAQEELLDFNGIGLSVMEISHRSKDFDGVIKVAEEKVRSLLNIGDNFKVLFLQGGASTQFSAVPLNLMGEAMDTGYFQQLQCEATDRPGVVGCHY
jgi:phosphoserine aminotransferase